jgi:hypothetical protein
MKHIMQHMAHKINIQQSNKACASVNKKDMHLLDY